MQGNPQDEWHWLERRHIRQALIGPSLQGREKKREREKEREKKRERERERPDQDMQQSLAVALFFTIAFIA